jgi:hypothetical protein
MSYNISVSKVESKIDTDNVHTTYSIIEEQRRKNKTEINELPNDLVGNSTYTNTMNKSKITTPDKKLKLNTPETTNSHDKKNIKRRSIAITDIINKRNTKDKPEVEKTH